jgi:hypothetical protein
MLSLISKSKLGQMAYEVMFAKKDQVLLQPKLKIWTLEGAVVDG